MNSYLVDYYEEAIRFKTVEIKADSYEAALDEAEKYNINNYSFAFLLIV